MAPEIPAAAFSPETLNRVSGLTDQFLAQGKPQAELTAKFAAEGDASVAVLRERAKRLEMQVRQLRELAQSVHQQRVREELAREFGKKESEIDLFYAGLLIAFLDNDEIDVPSYRQALDRLVTELTGRLGKNAAPTDKLALLNKFLFEEYGFHGSRNDYYHRSNSYLNEVLDDREGLPITLSVLYIELARRLGLNVVGVGLPGHFVVKFVPEKGESRLIDPYERGLELTRDLVAKRVREQTGRPLEERHLAATSKRDITIRMLRNLLNASSREQDFDSALKYLDTIVAIHPEAGEERWMRALLHFQRNKRQEAKVDVDWLNEHKPPEVNMDEVEQMQRLLERRM